MPTIEELTRQVSDDYCENVLFALRTMHRDKYMHWVSAADVGRHTKTTSTTYISAALFRLAAMGFLYMRDGDGQERFLVQLRREYRQ